MEDADYRRFSEAMLDRLRSDLYEDAMALDVKGVQAGGTTATEINAAYENMIAVISENVNGNAARPGMLHDMQGAGEAQVTGVEDGRRYYAFVNGSLYVWDYSISSVSDGISSLSWSKHTTFDVQAAMEGDTGTIWMMNASGRVAKIRRRPSADTEEYAPYSVLCCRSSTIQTETSR